MTRQHPLLRGAGRAAPIILGYVPIGLAFGVLANEAGLTLGATLGMSILVFAGSAQFLGVGMLAAGAGLLPITVATFFINLRHFLMSAALSPHLRKFGPVKLLPVAYELTDESFAIHSAGYQAGLDPAYAELAALNATAQIAWVASTGLGCLAGSLIPDPAALGLDFALPAMFLGLLAGRLTDRRQAMVAGLAAAGILAGTLILPSNWTVVLAAAAAASAGMVKR